MAAHDSNPTVLFGDLSDSDRRRIRAAAVTNDHPKGSCIYCQGEPAHNFCVVKSGVVSISELAGNGDETLLRFVLPGEVFGYVSLTSIDESVFSAFAFRPTTVMAWDRETALRLLREIPGMAVDLLSSMVNDIVFYYHLTRRLKPAPLEQRIQWGLGELLRAVGRPEPGGIVIEDVGLKHLAQLASTTIYGVSRELGKLEGDGVLRRQRGRLVILRPESLGYRHPGHSTALLWDGHASANGSPGT